MKKRGHMLMKKRHEEEGSVSDLVVPSVQRQAVSDGEPVPVHLEVCGVTEANTERQKLLSLQGIVQ